MPSEREMIENNGGFICFKKMGKDSSNNETTPNGKTCKDLFRLEGDLCLSRSFGDYIYKNIITVEPDIYDCEIGDDDRYLIIGTDGFWKVKFNLHFFILLSYRIWKS